MASRVTFCNMRYILLLIKTNSWNCVFLIRLHESDSLFIPRKKHSSDYRFVRNEWDLRLCSIYKRNNEVRV